MTPGGNDAVEYGMWEHPESVLYEVARGAQPDPLAVDQSLAGPVIDAVPFAKRRAVSYRQKMLNPVYVGAGLNWHLPAAVLPAGIVPKPGDVLVDGDRVRWTVQEAGRNKLGRTWKLVCLDLTLAHDLRDSVDVQRPGLSADAGGAVVRAWPPDGAGATTPYAAVPARVQLTREEPVDERGIRGMVRRYDVIVGAQMSVTLEDRVVWQGRYLDVVGYRQAQRVDELPVVEAVLKP